MTMNLIRLYKICENKDVLLISLQAWKLIPMELLCPKCKGNMTLCPGRPMTA